MKLSKAQIKQLIQDRGRGPEIKDTRITVYHIVDHLLDAWPPEQIAAWYDLTLRQVWAAVHFINEHIYDVISEYQKMLEREERGNPPEIQARFKASHAKLLAMKRRYKRAQHREKINARTVGGH